MDSASTRSLMVAFHRELLRGPRNAEDAGGTAGALQRAALAVMRAGAYRHPFYWASFVAMGNGSGLVTSSRPVAARRAAP